jgi:hypothetical protein
MFFKPPKETKEIRWTRHIKEKMKQYQLSEKRLIRIFKNPERKEEGVAPRTIAVMERAGTKKHPYEIWLMYQKKPKKTIMISAWKYPGKSPVRKPPITEEVLENLEEIIKN